MGEPTAGEQRTSRWVAVLVYSLLRVALFAVVWLVIEFLTPLSGLLALAAAILISGAISLVVLDRQRGAVGAAAAGFFGRINERIEASARAEDDDPPEPAEPPEPPGPLGPSGEGQRRPEDKPVAE